MKNKIAAIIFLVVLWPGLVFAQTKLKVAYPTVVGAMSVLWVTKEARLFEKHGLDVDVVLIESGTTTR